MEGPDAEHWRQAMEVELAAFRALETWDEGLVELPAGRRALGVKWVLVVKRDVEGRIIKYKARLVARGDQQQDGVDFDETHSSTVRLPTVRLLLAILAHHPSFRYLQFDVSNAYLHGELDRAIFVRQPPGFTDPTRPSAVRRLRKALYGLRQGGREWQKVFRAALERIGFRRSDADHGLYVRRREGGLVTFVATHVDDGLMIGNDGDLEEVVAALEREFEGGVKVTTGGLFLGMRITRAEDGTVTVDQGHYTRRVLDRFFPTPLSSVSTPVDPAAPVPIAGDESERTTVPYRELLGALVYATYLKRVCRYLTGTTNLGLRYLPSNLAFSSSLVSGWTDADHTGDRDTRLFGVGADSLAAGAISWNSRRQRSVAISSTEAEYVALSEAAREAVWLRQLLTDLGYTASSPTQIRGDNTGSLILASHPSSHSRTKHIGVHYHYTRERVEDEEIVLEWVPTGAMAADLFTKGLGAAKHLLFRGMCGMVDARGEGGCDGNKGKPRNASALTPGRKGGHIEI
ncbi:hypothetical protein JCM5296_003624 [Sporobolomyces johnsonii]